MKHNLGWTAVLTMALTCADVAAVAMTEIVVSVTRRESKVAETIGNIAVLDREALDMVAHAHIQEALVQVPGVDMHRNSGQEYLPAIRSPVLTGAGACGSFLMAEDGIPLRPAGFCNVNELFEAHSEQAARIEVIRGPANALYGSNAMHGVVNVIAPADFERPGRLGLLAGPWDYGRIQFSRGWEDFAFSFTGDHDGGYRESSGVDQQKLSLRHRHRGSDIQITSGMTAVNLNQETAGYLVGEDAYKDDDRVKTNPNPEAYRDASAVRLWSRIEKSGGAGRNWVVTPYLRHSSMDFLMHFLPGTPLEENGQRSAGLQSAVYLGSEENRLVAGLDMEYTRGWLKQSQDAPTQGSSFLRATIPQGKHYDYEVSAYQLAPFLQWRWQFHRRWQLTAGLRFETMEYDYDNRMLAGRTRDDGTACVFAGDTGCRYSRPADRDDDFQNWSPNLGFLYQFDGGHQLFATLSRGFRAPQTTELYRLQRRQRVADLNSEQLDSLEVGMRGGGKAFHYEVVAYTMRKDNVIFRNSDFFNVSDGETEHHGLELAVNYRFAPAWDIHIAGTVARHRYAYHDIQSGVDIHGNDVDTAPHHFANVQLGWDFADNARAELEWLRMGAYYTDPENRHRYEGHDLFHLRARWQPAPAWVVSAKLFNLFDTEYAERADFTTFGGDRYFPGKPRALYLGLEKVF